MLRGASQLSGPWMLRGAGQLSGPWMLSGAGQPVSRSLSSREHLRRSWGPSPGCVCVDISFRSFSRHPCLLDVTHLEVGFRCSVCWRGTTRFLVPRAGYPIKAGPSFTCGWAEAVLFLVKEQASGKAGLPSQELEIPV